MMYMRIVLEGKNPYFVFRLLGSSGTLLKAYAPPKKPDGIASFKCHFENNKLDCLQPPVSTSYYTIRTTEKDEE